MNNKFIPSKIGKAPEGYIPGISRGSQGFITRSDIGPMMTDISMGLNVARAQAVAQQRSRENNDVQGYQFNDNRFDPWSGFQGGNLFKMVDYDEEDQEADEIYATVDKYLEGKGGQKREEKVKKEIEKLKKKNPSVREKMKGEMKDLTKMSYDDWAKIPDIGDYRFKRSKRAEKFTPIPDSLLADRLEKAKLKTYDQSSLSKPKSQNGVKSKIPESLNVLGQARGSVLEIELDKASKAVSNQSVINKNGYLTALSQLPINTSDQIVDLKRAKLLMKSMINSKPNIARNWVGAARVEELDGKINKAKAILAKAVEYCPESEDVWYEAARLEKPEVGKAILSKGIKNCPQSVKLWIAAFRLEEDRNKKKSILKKSLEFIPQSEKIWKNLIDLSDGDEEAKLLLKHAVECLPGNLQIRLAYAKLLEYKEAKLELNKANRHFHMTEKSIWINAAKLEEANNNADKCRIIIKKALKKIIKKKKMVKREEWMLEAQECEAGGSIETCKSILFNIMQLDQKEEAYIKQWSEDAALFVQRGRAESARWVYNFGCELEPKCIRMWLEALNFERVHGNEAKYLKLLNKAIENNKDNQDFWLKAAKVYIQKGDAAGAKKILDEAIEANPGKYSLYIAKSEVEKECKNFEGARKVLKGVRKELKSVALWRRSIKLELELGDSNKALKVALKAVKNFPQDGEVLCDLAEVYTNLNKFHQAKSIYGSIISSKRLKRFERAWISLMQLVEMQKGIQKARAIFEKVKASFDKIPEEIWLQMIKMEERAGTEIISMLEEALREYPKNGELWSMSIEKEPLSKRKAKSYIALQKCENNIFVVNSIALIYWLSKSPEKCRSWFERSVTLNPKNGDSWGYYILFLRLIKETEEETNVVERCIKAEPEEGRFWKLHMDKPLNWDLTTRELLEKVMVDLKQHKNKISSF